MIGRYVCHIDTDYTHALIMADSLDEIRWYYVDHYSDDLYLSEHIIDNTKINANYSVIDIRRNKTQKPEPKKMTLFQPSVRPSAAKSAIESEIKKCEIGIIECNAAIRTATIMANCFARELEAFKIALSSITEKGGV